MNKYDKYPPVYSNPDDPNTIRINTAHMESALSEAGKAIEAVGKTIAMMQLPSIVQSAYALDFDSIPEPDVDINDLEQMVYQSYAAAYGLPRHFFEPRMNDSIGTISKAELYDRWGFDWHYVNGEPTIREPLDSWLEAGDLPKRFRYQRMFVGALFRPYTYKRMVQKLFARFGYTVEPINNRQGESE